MGDIQNTNLTHNSLIISDLPLIFNLNKLYKMDELTIIIENVHTMSEALNLDINPLNLEL